MFANAVFLVVYAYLAPGCSSVLSVIAICQTILMQIKAGTTIKFVSMAAIQITATSHDPLVRESFVDGSIHIVHFVLQFLPPLFRREMAIVFPWFNLKREGRGGEGGEEGSKGGPHV